MLDLAVLREAEEDGYWSNGELFRRLYLLIGEGKATREFKVDKFTEILKDKVFMFETDEGNFLVATEHPMWRLVIGARMDTGYRKDAAIRYIPRMFH